MQSNQFRRTRVAAAVAGLALALGAGQAFGAGFSLAEQSVSGLGNAYAGGAAAAEDASTVFSNPAGMARFSTMQIVAGLNIITPSIKFSNDGNSLPAFNQPLGGTGGDAGSTNYVPNLYLVVPINKQFAVGMGVGVPFGLKTEYDNGWLGRYQGLKSDIKTINVDVALSWRATDNFSVGVGVDYQQVKATFTSNVNYSGALAQGAQQAAAAGLIPASAVAPFIGATGGLDSNVNLDADDYAFGWDLGAIWDITPSTRLGGHYRSSLRYNASGNVNISNPTLPPLGPLAPIGAAVSAGVNAQLASGGITSSIELPAISNLSIFSRINPQWELMADVQFTQWSTIQELKFVRTGPGATLPPTPENFKDAWRYSVGANYILNDQWKFRGGVAYDESPVQNAERTPRLPDESRTWLSLGAQYTMSKNLKFDGGFTYIWIQDASISQNAGSTTSNGLVSGNYKASVTIFGVSGTYSF
jgi:long-chain fatty acid transport protein